MHHIVVWTYDPEFIYKHWEAWHKIHCIHITYSSFVVKLNVDLIPRRIILVLFFLCDASSWPLAYLGKFIPVPVRPLQDYFKPRCCRKARRGESPWMSSWPFSAFILIQKAQEFNWSLMQTRRKADRRRAQWVAGVNSNAIRREDKFYWFHGNCRLENV